MLAVLAAAAVLFVCSQSHAKQPELPNADGTVRITTDCEQLIFEPNEQFSFRLGLVLPDYVVGRFVGLKIELRRVTEEKGSVAYEDDELHVPVNGLVDLDLAIPMPALEGAYTLSITATPPRALQPWKNLGGRSTVVARREFQVVVFNPQPAEAAATGWRDLGVIQPENARWWQGLPNWAKVQWIPGLGRRGQAGSTPPEVVANELSSFLRLPPTDRTGQPHWQAYALPVDVVGRPHRLEIEYPTAGELQLGFSIIQPQAEGVAYSVHDQGTVFIDKHSTRSSELAHHQIVFWPRTSSPVLLVTNQHPTAAGLYGRIRVSAGPERLSPLPTTRPGKASQPQRMIATYFAARSYPEILDARPAGPPTPANVRNDWHRFYQASQRLADYVKFAGFNSAIVGIGDELLLGKPAGANDPQRANPSAPAGALLSDRELPAVDGLELLLRTFDREGLTLVPAIDLSSRDLAAARNLIQRYGRHRSLGGVAWKLSLRDPLRGMPLGTSPVGWRTTETTQICRQLAALVRADGTDRQLILTTEELFQNPEVRRRLHPTILRKADWSQLLRELGIDRAQLAQIPGLVVLAPQYVSPAAPLGGRAVDLEINRAASSLRNSGGAGHGALVYHHPQFSQLSSLPDEKLLGRDQHGMTLVGHPNASGPQTRQPFVEALLEGDLDVIVDGGQAPAAGHSQEVAALLRTIGWLPAGADKVDTTREQPIAVRRFQENDRTTFCVINESAWTVDTQLTIQIPERATVSYPTVGSEAALPSRTVAAGSHAWPVTLQPYGVQAFRLDAAGAEVTGIQFQVPQAVRQELAGRIDALGRRELNSEQATVYDALANPSFEPLGGETSEQPIAGWTALRTDDLAQIAYATVEASASDQCLLLQTAGKPAGVRSNEFAVPPTGQLAMTVSVRGDQVDKTTQLRIVFEAEGDPRYRQMTMLGAGAQFALPTEANWENAYTFPVYDLPMDSRRPMHVQFELHGTGRVRIDNVRLNDVPFSLSNLPQSTQERFTLLKTILAARSALESDDLVNCQQLLDSYWLRFIEEYLPVAEPIAPLDEPRIADGPPTPEEEKPSRPEPAPSLTERIRSFWPWH